MWDASGSFVISSFQDVEHCRLQTFLSCAKHGNFITFSSSFQVCLFLWSNKTGFVFLDSARYHIRSIQTYFLSFFHWFFLPRWLSLKIKQRNPILKLFIFYEVLLRYPVGIKISDIGSLTFIWLGLKVKQKFNISYMSYSMCPSAQLQRGRLQVSRDFLGNLISLFPFHFRAQVASSSPAVANMPTITVQRKSGEMVREHIILLLVIHCM